MVEYDAELTRRGEHWDSTTAMTAKHLFDTGAATEHDHASVALG